MWTNENKIHLMYKNGSGINKSKYFDGCGAYEKIKWEKFQNELDCLLES